MNIVQAVIPSKCKHFQMTYWCVIMQVEISEEGVLPEGVACIGLSEAAPIVCLAFTNSGSHLAALTDNGEVCSLAVLPSDASLPPACQLIHVLMPRTTTCKYQVFRCTTDSTCVSYTLRALTESAITYKSLTSQHLKGGLLCLQVLVWHLHNGSNSQQSEALDIDVIARTAEQQAPLLFSMGVQGQAVAGSVAWIALPASEGHVLVAGSQNNTALYLWHSAGLVAGEPCQPLQVSLKTS